MNDYLWPITCMAIGLGLLVLDVFVISFGVLIALGIGFVLVGLFLAYQVSLTFLLISVVVLGVLIPSCMAFALKFWDRSPFAKIFQLSPPTPEEIVAPPENRDRLAILVGQIGRAVTTLRPSGSIDCQGRTLDALAESGMIAKNDPVEILRIQGSQLVVRRAEASVPVPAARPQATVPPEPTPDRSDQADQTDQADPVSTPTPATESSEKPRPLTSGSLLDQPDII